MNFSYFTGKKNGKDKYESPNPRRTHTMMSIEDQNAGKKSTWYEVEISGKWIKNVLGSY